MFMEPRVCCTFSENCLSLNYYFYYLYLQIKLIKRYLDIFFLSVKVTRGLFESPTLCFTVLCSKLHIKLVFLYLF